MRGNMVPYNRISISCRRIFTIRRFPGSPVVAVLNDSMVADVYKSLSAYYAQGLCYFRLPTAFVYLPLFIRK